ncbi:hypothetical protein EJ04DRAFT_510651 [Polyplosphaeria fusca]|uniref:Uncharacterized protein n=1 Tax=Polyplosphaeria fusca TaxID=682080 RepID=A0A9P4V545_9PLEO|nr:hypothetical protein EJ04DRAFT_510651 [Polyplosphaeria fusca]
MSRPHPCVQPARSLYPTLGEHWAQSIPFSTCSALLTDAIPTQSGAVRPLQQVAPQHTPASQHAVPQTSPLKYPIPATAPVCSSLSSPVPRLVPSRLLHHLSSPDCIPLSLLLAHCRFRHLGALQSLSLFLSQTAASRLPRAFYPRHSTANRIPRHPPPVSSVVLSVTRLSRYSPRPPPRISQSS